MMNPAAGQSVLSVAKSSTHYPMSSNGILQRLVGLQSPTELRECRHCGYSIDEEVEECPECGSQEVATYTLE